MAFDCTSLDKVPITTSFIPTPILIANYSDSNKNSAKYTPNQHGSKISEVYITYMEIVYLLMCSYINGISESDQSLLCNLCMKYGSWFIMYVIVVCNWKTSFKSK